jgi:hypothetical protein
VDHHQDWWLVENGGSQKIKQHLMNVAVFFFPDIFWNPSMAHSPWYSGLHRETTGRWMSITILSWKSGQHVSTLPHVDEQKTSRFFASDMPITNFKRMYKLKWNWAVGNFPARSNET